MKNELIVQERVGDFVAECHREHSGQLWLIRARGPRPRVSIWLAGISPFEAGRMFEAYVDELRRACQR
jgi:hypothetical protein